MGTSATGLRSCRLGRSVQHTCPVPPCWGTLKAQLWVRPLRSWPGCPHPFLEDREEQSPDVHDPLASGKSLSPHVRASLTCVNFNLPLTWSPIPVSHVHIVRLCTLGGRPVPEPRGQPSPARPGPEHRSPPLLGLLSSATAPVAPSPPPSPQPCDGVVSCHG